jgi:hypothetical protein
LSEAAKVIEPRVFDLYPFRVTLTIKRDRTLNPVSLGWEAEGENSTSDQVWQLWQEGEFFVARVDREVRLGMVTLLVESEAKAIGHYPTDYEFDDDDEPVFDWVDTDLDSVADELSKPEEISSICNRAWLRSGETIYRLGELLREFASNNNDSYRAKFNLNAQDFTDFINQGTANELTHLISYCDNLQVQADKTKVNERRKYLRNRQEQAIQK